LGFGENYYQDFYILGFEDPLYTVESSDRISVLINRTPTIDFVNDATNDTTILKTHIENSYYLNSTSAPSFLMRFTGNLSPSIYGIESFVNIENWENQMGSYNPDRSIIDYLYFGNQTTTGIGLDYCDYSDISSDIRDWVRIDDLDNHQEIYEIVDLEKVTC